MVPTQRHLKTPNSRSWQIVLASFLSTAVLSDHMKNPAAVALANLRKGCKENKSDRKAQSCRANLEKARAKRWAKNNLQKGVDTTAQLRESDDMKNETVLLGVRNGNEDWQEELLSTNPATFEAVKAISARDGFGRFRVATIDLTTPPDFRKSINTKTS